MQKLTLMLIVALMLCSVHQAVQSQENSDEPKGVRLHSAEYHLSTFEKRVASMNGRKMSGSYGNRAKEVIEALHASYPDHEKVKELKKRLDAALKLAEGTQIEITKQMIAYREQEDDLKKEMGPITQKVWGEYLAKIKKDEKYLEKPFPTRNPEKVPLSKMAGKIVVLDRVMYPQRAFMSMGKTYVSVGSFHDGFYFVPVVDDSFGRSYRAMRRWQQMMGEQLRNQWTVVGRITEPTMVATGVIMGSDPERVDMGWEIEVLAIYVSTQVFARSDIDTENAEGWFAGEKEIREKLESSWSIKNVPEDVSPDRLVEIMVTSVKEKNKKLYYDCLWPANIDGPGAKRRAEFFWDIFQRNLANHYVHVSIDKVLPIEELQAHEKRAEDQDAKIERVRVMVLRHNEKGEVQGFVKPVILYRRDGGRWYVQSGYPI